jgi:hypothetical protein
VVGRNEFDLFAVDAPPASAIAILMASAPPAVDIGIQPDMSVISRS